jgi:hypothetical protein
VSSPRFILVRRAGNGWLMATFTAEGRDVGLEVGPWEHVRDVVPACQRLMAMELAP